MSELEELTTRALALPAKGRAELAELLIQSLEEVDDKDVKPAWLVEIYRRDQEIRAVAHLRRELPTLSLESLSVWPDESDRPRADIPQHRYL